MNEDVGAAVTRTIMSFQESAAALQEIRGRYGAQAWQGNEAAVESHILYASLTDAASQIGKEYALGNSLFGVQYSIGDVMARSPLLSYSETIKNDIQTPIINAKGGGDDALDLKRLAGLSQYFHHEIIRNLQELKQRLGPPILRTGQGEPYSQQQQPQPTYNQFSYSPLGYAPGYASSPQVPYQGYGYGFPQQQYGAPTGYPYQQPSASYPPHQYPPQSYPLPPPNQQQTPSSPVQPTKTDIPTSPDSESNKKSGFGRIFPSKIISGFHKREHSSSSTSKSTPAVAPAATSPSPSVGLPVSLPSSHVPAGIMSTVAEMEDTSASTGTQPPAHTPSLSVPAGVPSVVEKMDDKPSSTDTQPPAPAPLAEPTAAQNRVSIKLEDDFPEVVDVTQGPSPSVAPGHNPNLLSTNFNRLSIAPDHDPTVPSINHTSSSIGRSDTRSSSGTIPSAVYTNRSSVTSMLLPHADPLSAGKQPATVPGNPSAPATRPDDLQRLSSVASSTLSSTANIGAATPSKTNNFLGFCKMAWKARENLDKAFEVTSVLVDMNMYNTPKCFLCRGCYFKGKPGPPAESSKTQSSQAGGHYFEAYKHKHKYQFDPAVNTHTPTGIKYRWLFLAKSHTKQKDQKSVYGCVFCVDLGRSTGVYATPNALMEHIGQVHIMDEGGISAAVATRNRCVTGPWPVNESDKSWDMFLPKPSCVSI